MAHCPHSERSCQHSYNARAHCPSCSQNAEVMHVSVRFMLYLFSKYVISEHSAQSPRKPSLAMLHLDKLSYHMYS